ncbi:MAG: glycosyltransferase family 39 protein [Chloroflexi bacterium]|nr:glycosyltransferase family 39 protein [Chloroflexota bacterium]
MTTRLRNSSERRWLLGGVLALFALRLLLTVVLPRVVKWDEPDYLLLGQHLWAGQGFTSGWVPEVHYTPLYPLVTGFFNLIVHDLERASDVAYALFGALLLLPVWFLSRRVYGRRTAWTALALLAIFPPLTISVLYWGTMTEPLYLFLVFGGLALLLAAHERQSWPAMGMAGVAFGLAYLTRPEAVSFFVAGLLWWLLSAHFHRPQNPRLAAGGGGLFIAAFLLVSAPYVVYLHTQTGHWSLSGKLAVTWDIGRAVQDRDPAEYDRVTAGLDSEGKEIIWFSPHRFDRNMFQLVAANPEGLLRRMVRNARTLRGDLIGRTAFPLLLLPFLALAWFTDRWSRRRLRGEALLAIGLLPLFTFLPFHIELRFFAPVFVVLLIWSARGLVALGDWLVATLGNLWPVWVGGARRKRMIFFLPGVLVLAYFLLSMPATFQQGVQSSDFGHKTAGLWLRQNTPADAVILTRDIAVALYADRRWVPSPHAEFDRYLAYARRQGADYLVTDTRELTVLRPHLRFLLDTAHPPAGLEAVYDQAGNKGRTLVFRLLPPADGG